MTDFDQLDLHRVERELGRRRLRSDFEPEVEREYVLAVRQQRAGTRTAMDADLECLQPADVMRQNRKC